MPTRAGRRPSWPAAPTSRPPGRGAGEHRSGGRHRNRLLRAIPANNLNKLIGEMATALPAARPALLTPSGAGRRSPRSSSPTSSSSPNCSPMRRPPPCDDRGRPELRQDLANTAALVQVLAQHKAGCTSSSPRARRPSRRWTSRDDESANIGWLLHDTANILTNLAPPTNLQPAQGLEYNQYFFGAVDQSRWRSGQADDDDAGRTRTRPAHPPRPAADPRASPARRTPRPARSPTGTRAPGASRCSGRRRPGDPTRFQASRRRSLVAPGAQEADVELPVTATAPSTSTAYSVPGSSVAVLLTLSGVIVVPALALAWGARPSRRRTRRRA